jgi:hypothetical protein
MGQEIYPRVRQALEPLWSDLWPLVQSQRDWTEFTFPTVHFSTGMRGVRREGPMQCRTRVNYATRRRSQLLYSSLFL